MGHRLSRNPAPYGARLAILVATFLLLSGGPSTAQLAVQQGPPPAFPSAPLTPLAEPPKLNPAAKELSAQEVDTLVEKAFGRDCPELKRPIRMWIPDVGAVIAAEKATLRNTGHSVAFESASVGVPNGALPWDTFSGDAVEVSVETLVAKPSELPRQRVALIAITDKLRTITLKPGNTIGAATGTQVAQPDGSVRIVAATDLPPEMRARRSLSTQFEFKIDPQSPVADLLPAPPKTRTKLPLWTNEDLAKVSELKFGESMSRELPKPKAMDATAHVMAKINHLNRQQKDGFMLAMIERRTDLHGLPFQMGEECRTGEKQAELFKQFADSIRRALPKSNDENQLEITQKFWQGFIRGNALIQQGNVDAKTLTRATQESANRALIAALTQILMPESEHFRIGLAKCLTTVPHVDATKALARLVLFSPEDEVRAAAIEGLKLRRDKDYSDILVQGFHYPLPAVSKRAAEALVKLECKDLLASLVEVLESPDPRLPVAEKRDGKDVTVVRELVKVNHHRNCLLCHAPGNTDSTPQGVLKVAVPLPAEPLLDPAAASHYYSTPPATPDIVVRIDMTYLRQDFSVMMPVSDAHPWPEMQRFDFLVRSRVLTATEAQAYESCCDADEPGRLSPYHRAALYALRELTGRDTEPTAAAWRKLLKLAAR